MMRRLILILLLIVAISCNNDNETKNEKQIDTTHKKTITIKIDTTNYEILSDTVISTVSIDMLPDKPPFFKHFDKKTFLDSLINSVISGKIQGYDFFDYTKLNANEIKENLGMINDTISVEDPETGKITKEIKNNFDIGNIRELVFVEKWLWNRNKNIVYKKILAYGPVIYIVKDDSLGGYPVLKRVPFVILSEK